MEEWKDISGYEGIYQVSNCGNVRRVEWYGRIINRGLKPVLGKRGYLTVVLSVHSNRKRFFVHKLVAMMFIGERPDGYDIRHLDGNRHNNCASNLEYGTRAENEHDKIKHGKDNSGERCGASKLTKMDVENIRTMIESVKLKNIAKMYGVSGSTIGDIKHNRTWRIN